MQDEKRIAILLTRVLTLKSRGKPKTALFSISSIQFFSLFFLLLLANTYFNSFRINKYKHADEQTPEEKKNKKKNNSKWIIKTTTRK